MSVLDNARWEAFAHRYAAGMSAGRAYETAGFQAKRNSSYTEGHKLLKKPEIQNRIREIRHAAAERLHCTPATIAVELDAAFEVAREAGNAAAMVAAATAKAKVLGILVERPKHDHQHRFETMSTDELLTEFAQLIAEMRVANGMPPLPLPDSGIRN
jgi:hypothetical protein